MKEVATQVFDHLMNLNYSQVRDQDRDQVQSQVWTQVELKASRLIDTQVTSSLRNQVREDLDQQTMSYHSIN
jgi:hypothetical protein